jgi:hypothetical protein
VADVGGRNVNLRFLEVLEMQGGAAGGGIRAGRGPGGGVISKILIYDLIGEPLD